MDCLFVILGMGNLPVEPYYKIVGGSNFLRVFVSHLMLSLLLFVIITKFFAQGPILFAKNYNSSLPELIFIAINLPGLIIAVLAESLSNILLQKLLDIEWFFWTFIFAFSGFVWGLVLPKLFNIISRWTSQ